jgi:hypothetical protein
MRDTSIVSPGILSNGFLIRREAAKAISTIEIQCSRTPGGKTPSAAKLKAFFDDCSAKLVAFVELVLPTVTTRVRTSATLATITMSEALTPTNGSLPVSAFVFTPARTVTNVQTTGSTILITVAAGLTVGDSLTYTPPAGTVSAGNPVLQVNGVKDVAGNLAATFTGVLA